MAVVNYAVGDVHGCIEKLNDLLDEIDSDIARHYSIADEITVIFVGDYCDRGKNSKQVIERIRTYDQYATVALYGNHEDMMVHSLGPNSAIQRESLKSWCDSRNGGFETLLSYGFSREELKEAVQNNAVDMLRKRVGSDHLAWLHTLPVTHETDLAIYVHACIDPDKPLTEQNHDVCIWSRSAKFMSGMFDIGKPVVHGHTIQARASRKGGRIGVDTGAYLPEGKLSALVIDSEGREDFIAV